MFAVDVLSLQIDRQLWRMVRKYDMRLLFLFHLSQSCGEFAVCTIMHGRCMAQGKESSPRHPYIGMLHRVAHLVVLCILPDSLLDMHSARFYAFGRLLTHCCAVLCGHGSQ